MIRLSVQFAAVLAVCVSCAAYAGQPTVGPRTVLAPVIDSPLSVTANVGEFFSYVITASNGPNTYSATGQPSFLLTETGQEYQGVPDTEGTFTFDITATNFGGSDTKTLTLTVLPAKSVVTISSDLNATTNVAFSYQVAATNNPQNYSALGLPPGFTINATSGLITGTTPSEGVYDVQIKVTNAGGDTYAGTAIHVYAVPVISSPLVINVAVGDDIGYAPYANNTDYASFSVFGLPSGLTFYSGEGYYISGTIDTVGTYFVTLIASNPAGSDTKTLTINVFPTTPVIVDFSTFDNPGLIDTPILYTVAVTDVNTPSLSYSIDFGDGFPVVTGTCLSGVPFALSHTYNVPGDFTVSFSVNDGGAPVSTTVLQSIPAPGSGAFGLPNISDNRYPVVNPDSGVSIDMCDSNGGVIKLCIEYAGLSKAGARVDYDVSTAWGDVVGRSTTVRGTRPVHQHRNHGVFVATTVIRVDPGSQPKGRDDEGDIIAMGRRTLSIGSYETGENAIGDKSRGAAGTPTATGIAASRLKGKFFFREKGVDVVSLVGTILLPAGFNTAGTHEFNAGVGNVMGTLELNARGSGKLPGLPPLYKKAKIFFPPGKPGILTSPKTAVVDIQLAGTKLTTAGFDTEGISNKLPGAKNLLRMIQVALVLDGLSYQALVPVSFDVTPDGRSGSFDLIKIK